LNAYRGKENSYVDDNIQEIQDLYKEEGRIKEKEVILIKPYKVSESTMMLLAQTSFITDEVENLFKYMKFIPAPM